MRTALKYLGSIMAVATGISILACGGTGTQGGEACTFDDECSAGFVCNEFNECEAGCNTDSDCPVGSVCVERQNNSPGGLCDAGGSVNNFNPNNFNPNNTNAGCSTNEECTADVDGVCIDGACEYPDNQSMYKVIMIQDTSEGEAACSPNTSDPGSDLIAVTLSDSNGQTLGWGEAVNQNLGEGDNNDFISPGRLDGNPQSLASGQCPNEAFDDSGVYSMGCGGWITIKFSDAQGVPLDITQGSIIEVYEYGGFCARSMSNDSEGADEYEVLLCTDSASALNGSEASCDYYISSGETKGLGQFEVTTLP
ncbi:MAG: hypothetical protein VYE40_14455 [Myxococcota bacterium]|nr:hypothetical protein [Myxococcota bacterium]